MRTIKICLIVIVFSNSIFAQAVGQWKIYSDMKSINDAVVTSSGVWAATQGAAFKFNSADSSFSVLTKADGLNSQALTAIAVDNKDRIWIGSQEGYINILDTKDNSLQKIIDISNSNKTLKQINGILVKGDSVYVSFDFGLAIIDAKTISFIDSFLKLGNFPAESKVISTYKSTLVYAVTQYGVAIQKAGAQNLSVPESWDTYYLSSFLPSFPSPSASRVLEFNGQILLATSRGVFQLINKSWQPSAFQESNVSDMVVSGNSLFVITPHELYKYSAGQSTLLYQNSAATFNTIKVAADQTIYISSTQGLIEIKNSKVRTLYPNGPAGNLFVNLSVDPSGNLWVATGKNNTGKGFFKFDGSVWKVFDRTNYPILPSNDYYNVYAAPDSSIYLCNWGNGLAILKNEKIDTITTYNSTLVGYYKNPLYLAVPDCKTDSKGNLWILNTQSASQKPLSVLTKQNNWINFSFSNPQLTQGDNVEKLVIDQYDTKWFTVTVTGSRFGLYYFNENKTLDDLTNDTQGFLNSANGLLSDLITALAIDQRGYLWVGTNVGLNVIIDPSKPKVTSNLGLALRNQTVTCIAIDPLDQKWIGTTQGVFVLSSDGIQLLHQYDSNNSPLPNDEIKSIAFDAKNGIAYIGTDFGLAALQTSSIQPLQSFSEIFVYPNPFILNDGTTSLTIDGLIGNSSIKIFSISGKLINEFDSPGGKIAFWDGKDLNGNPVPTGIYIIAAYDQEANNVKTSKVAVVRK
ncbi:MAG: T9SS type A sorting domain-containing protein [Ignavibacteriales bacterium]|nr:T9SS type A sorting domain-containing protein [Ignavibacteriales bacterium]